MSDNFPAEIDIGGPVTKSDAVELCLVIRDQSVKDRMFYDTFNPQSPEDLVTAASEHPQKLLRVCDDQASFGEFPELEIFLRSKNIPYDRYSDAFCAYQAMVSYFRPDQGVQEFAIGGDNSPMVSCRICKEVLELINEAGGIFGKVHAGDDEEPDAWHYAAMRKLTKARELLKKSLPDVAPLEPFTIVED